MTHLVSLLVLAFAVSLDSFGVGITYGMRKVMIPMRSICIIALCSGIMIVIAMGVGKGISYFVTPRFAEVLGGIILIMVGLWALYNITRSRINHQENEEDEQPIVGVWTLEIKRLGIVIQVLRTPMAADIDHSGVISGGEAFVLGLALALDAFGAGIGASLMGFSPWLTAVLIAFMSSLFVFMGMKFGVLFSNRLWMSKLSYLPGIILITLGLVKIM